jgi:leukotriene-A4 hydrolase
MRRSSFSPINHAFLYQVCLGRRTSSTAYSSAHITGVPNLYDVSSSGPTRLFSFQQKVPIPPYLIALAVGELESRELSSRSRVWSEPSMVEAGAFEFAETAKFLDAGKARSNQLLH